MPLIYKFPTLKRGHWNYYCYFNPDPNFQGGSLARRAVVEELRNSRNTPAASNRNCGNNDDVDDDDDNDEYDYEPAKSKRRVSSASTERGTSPSSGAEVIIAVSKNSFRRTDGQTEPRVLRIFCPLLMRNISKRDEGLSAFVFTGFPRTRSYSPNKFTSNYPQSKCSYIELTQGHKADLATKTRYSI